MQFENEDSYVEVILAFRAEISDKGKEKLFEQKGYPMKPAEK
jgi:hypothetical protein